MKTKLINTTVLATVAFLAACHDTPEKDDAAALIFASSAASAAQDLPDPGLPEIRIEIAGNDLMKYDVTSIEARPGQKVTVTLRNIGTMPKISMGHNFVLLAQDMDPMKFVEISGIHMGRNFIAPELDSKVIAHTKLLGPGENDTISFAAPRNPGSYTYICSFPGHCAIGMRGVLTVK
jgi:azurin